MTEREMLLYAAKASNKAAYLDGSAPENVADWRWNPLVSDADCAAMEAFVKLDVIWNASSVESFGGVVEFYSDHGMSRSAARRKASTRAAAEIGKEIK